MLPSPIHLQIQNPERSPRLHLLVIWPPQKKEDTCWKNCYKRPVAKRKHAQLNTGRIHLQLSKQHWGPKPHLKIDAWAVRSAQIPANLIFFFKVSTQSKGNRASARHLPTCRTFGLIFPCNKVLMVDPAISSKLLLDTPTPILLLLNLFQIASIMIHIL